MAEIVGRTWPEKARRALVEIRGGHDEDGDETGVRLLADIRRAFNVAETDWFPSGKLIEALLADESSPWREVGRQKKPLTATGLAHRLRPFGVAPHEHEIEGERARGYRLEQFKGAFSRWLVVQPADPRDMAQTSQNRPFQPRGS